jgi:hypothetical protein
MQFLMQEMQRPKKAKSKPSRAIFTMLRRCVES